MRLWVVLEDGIEDEIWDGERGIVGVFNSRQRAIDACCNDRCFLEPVQLNQSCGEDPVSFEEQYYPLAPEKGIVHA